MSGLHTTADANDGANGVTLAVRMLNKLLGVRMRVYQRTPWHVLLALLREHELVDAPFLGGPDEFFRTYSSLDRMKRIHQAAPKVKAPSVSSRKRERKRPCEKCGRSGQTVAGRCGECRGPDLCQLVEYQCRHCRRMIKAFDEFLRVVPGYSTSTCSDCWEAVRARQEAKRNKVEFFAHRGSVVLNSKRSSVDFYESKEWRTLRYEVLRESGGKCVLCGSKENLHVDHIKPRSKFPELQLIKSNLQVLCADCNMGKGNTDSIDWRTARR